MRFITTNENICSSNASCVVVPFFADRKMSQQHHMLIELDTASDGYISELIKVGDLSGKLGTTSLLYDLSNVTSERILIVGCGVQEELSIKNLSKAMIAAYKILEQTNIKDIAIYWMQDEFYKHKSLHSTKYLIRQIISSLYDASYKFDEFKKTKSSYSLDHIQIFVDNSNDKEKINLEIEIATYLNQAKTTYKNLANMPANICTPDYLAKTSTALAQQFKNVNTAVLNMDEIRDLGMGAFYAVAQGSNNHGKLISISYRGAHKDQAPIVLIGKGITFDTGGNSLKQAASMIGMKYDMCGAATVIAIMEFAAKSKLPINIIGLIAAAENMPGANATRPDDIVTTMSGLTVEILNTDAEGRLVLCDCLTYAKRFNPEMVIDFATLTGSTKDTFGETYSALFCNDDKLAKDLITASQRSQDLAWRMPLAPEYHAMLDSKVADMANIGTGGSGAIVAACFLEKFVDDMRWAHLDIAGSVGSMSGKDRGANGRPLPLMADFLLNLCKYG